MYTFDSVINALNLEVGDRIEAAATQLSLCALLSGLRRHIEVQSFMGSLREEGPGGSNPSFLLKDPRRGNLPRMQLHALASRQGKKATEKENKGTKPGTTSGSVGTSHVAEGCNKKIKALWLQ